MAAAQKWGRENGEPLLLLPPKFATLCDHMGGSAQKLDLLPNSTSRGIFLKFSFNFRLGIWSFKLPGVGSASVSDFFLYIADFWGCVVERAFPRQIWNKH